MEENIDKHSLQCGVVFLFNAGGVKIFEGFHSFYMRV
jgi:hypothetical protein